MSGALLAAGVAAVGGIASLGRFLLDGAVQRRHGGEFPLGTFCVNVSGSLALGLLAGASLDHDASLLAATAALGSFTTFSTWMLEAQRLAEDGELALAAANALLSLVAGLAAAALGLAIGNGL